MLHKLETITNRWPGQPCGVQSHIVATLSNSVADPSLTKNVWSGPPVCNSLQRCAIGILNLDIFPYPPVIPCRKKWTFSG